MPGQQAEFIHFVLSIARYSGIDAMPRRHDIPFDLIRQNRESTMLALASAANVS
jgi:hypothetical protein